ncbi:hypothetical protein AXE77_05665 [Gardnerella vaginalis]|uniref:Uncharacterized protein n=1 Tax=Gardnerella vaginalis TaxID=2702 RepID=A0A3E1IZJ0_GARVA|nr:hypothetical protein AXE77_05665 [Gardnerella vaginalis]
MILNILIVVYLHNLVFGGITLFLFVTSKTYNTLYILYVIKNNNNNCMAKNYGIGLVLNLMIGLLYIVITKENFYEMSYF